MAPYLSDYSTAGGRLLMTGDRLSSHMIGFEYPKTPPIPDDDAEGADFDRDSFIWQIMRMRNTIVGIDNGDPVREQESGGLIGARSRHPAYPDIWLDYSKWDPYLLIDGPQYQGGVKFWEGFRGEVRPFERLSGLDTLYTPVTFDSTYAFGAPPPRFADAVIGWRYESTRADTLGGTQQGRIVVLDFQPYFFEPNAVQDAGTSSINWLVTGLDH
ncbi:MAG: hypothetical protein R3E97_14760 [Candidatus Eisenbacteria bacterium]